MTVSSRLPPWPVNLPVLTSMTTIASVRSITSEPPLGSQTLRSSALASCSSIRYVAKTSTSLVQRCRRGARSGATCETYPWIVCHASSPLTMTLEKSSLKMSRTTRTVMSGSPYSSDGALEPPPFLAFFWMSSHCAWSRSTSLRSSSSLAPSAAVRTMTPASSGTIFLRMVFSRARSVSGSLRLMPVIEPSGTYTR